MNNPWYIIIPKEATNLIKNPSFEGATSSLALSGWNAGCQLNSSTASQVFGLVSGLPIYKSGQTGSLLLVSASTAKLTLDANTEYVFSAYVKGNTVWTGGTVYCGASAFSGASQDRLVEYKNEDLGGWKRISTRVTTGSYSATGLFHVSFDTPPSDGQGIYIDGVQVEKGSRITTYIDGEQPGCYWNGYYRKSISTRKADEPTGGYEYNFADDLMFPIETQVGVGAAPQNNIYHKLGTLDGDLYQGTKLQSRKRVILAGTFDLNNNAKLSTYHGARSSLISAFNNRTLGIKDGNKPRRLIYKGAATEKFFDASYSAGLELNGQNGFNESIAITLDTEQPLMYARNDVSKSLSYRNGFTIAGLVGQVDGIWGNLGASTVTSLTGITAITSDNENLYVGGYFTSMGGGSTPLNWLFRYNFADQSLSKLGGDPAGGGGGINQVLDLHVGANGSLYAVGLFATINGVSVGRLGKWDGSSWSAVGGASTNTGTIRAVRTAPDGTLWIGGDFNNFAGIANADYLAYYDGSWNAVSVGTDAAVYAIDVDNNNNVYIGGNFTAAGGATHTRIVKYNSIDGFTAMGGGLNGICRVIKTAQDGSVYVGGDFTTADGKAIKYLAKWNGATFEPVGGQELNGAVYKIDIDSNGNLIVGGNFSQVGDNTLLQRAALFNGSVWGNIDINLPGNPLVSAVHVDRFDNIYLGSNVTGTTYSSYENEVTYTGTENGYPVIIIDNSHNSTAATIQKIANLTTGAVIYLEQVVAAGDTVTIDFRPKTRGMYSRFNGNITGGILPNSDMGSFFLVTSNTGERVNRIKMFITGSSPRTYITCKSAFNGVDG